MWICEKNARCVDECDNCQHYIEVEPVRHGKWNGTFRHVGKNVNTGEPMDVFSYDCSVCNWHTGNQGKSFNYCPYCGAKMDGE